MVNNMLYIVLNSKVAAGCLNLEKNIKKNKKSLKSKMQKTNMLNVYKKLYLIKEGIKTAETLM